MTTLRSLAGTDFFNPKDAEELLAVAIDLDPSLMLLWQEAKAKAKLQESEAMPSASAEFVAELKTAATRAEAERRAQATEMTASMAAPAEMRTAGTTEQQEAEVARLTAELSGLMATQAEHERQRGRQDAAAAGVRMELASARAEVEELRSRKAKQAAEIARLRQATANESARPTAAAATEQQEAEVARLTAEQQHLVAEVEILAVAVEESNKISTARIESARADKDRADSLAAQLAWCSRILLAEKDAHKDEAAKFSRRAAAFEQELSAATGDLAEVELDLTNALNKLKDVEALADKQADELRQIRINPATTQPATTSLDEELIQVTAEISKLATLIGPALEGSLGTQASMDWQPQWVHLQDLVLHLHQEHAGVLAGLKSFAPPTPPPLRKFFDPQLTPNLRLATALVGSTSLAAGTDTTVARADIDAEWIDALKRDNTRMQSEALEMAALLRQAMAGQAELGAAVERVQGMAMSAAMARGKEITSLQGSI
eukprot:SAG22_NODE_2850_length_2159_cov_1.780097_2_plen_491_part_01